MKVSATLENWRDIICCGLENEQLDFKSHQNWETIGRTGRAKFAKHAMALANTLGGYVVIGVGEDKNGNPTDYVGMTEDEASSFDPSTVGQTINTFADPAVSMDVVRPVIDGRRYVVLVIYPFRNLPHVCTENCEHELQRGAFYIRTPDARSKVATKSSELHLLIQRALRNQRMALGRMLRGILYEDRIGETPEEAIFPPLLNRCRLEASARLGHNRLKRSPHFELFCQPDAMFSDVGITDITRAADTIERPSLKELPGAFSKPSFESVVTNESLQGLLAMGESPVISWEIFSNGFFYLSATLGKQADTGSVQASRLAKLALFCLAVLGQLYTLLHHEDALLKITMRIPNSENATLFDIPVTPAATPAKCRIMDVEVTRKRSAADLEGGAAVETAMRFFVEICARFSCSFDKAGEEELQHIFGKLL